MSRTHAQQRELQAHIARLRRRLDRRASGLIDRSLLTTNWKAYVQKHPARALFAAAGAGMAASFLVSGAKTSGRFGAKLYDAAVSGAWGKVWGEIERMIAQAVPRGESPDA